MYDTKYKIGKYNTMRVVYQRSNMHAKGGYLNKDRFQVGEHQVKNYIQRMKKRRDTIRELIENNFEAGESKHIVLTFSDKALETYASSRECNAAFKSFIKKLKYRYIGFKYVAVIEIQKANARGKYHYHMVCNLPYVEHEKLLNLWGNGSVWIKENYDIEGIAGYVTKEMWKLNDLELRNEKAYLCSKGLKRNIEVRSWNQEEAELYKETAEKLKDVKGILDHKIENKYAGIIEYKKYKVKSDLFTAVPLAVKK